MSPPPFLFLNHGILSAWRVGKEEGVYLGFRDPVPIAARHQVLVGLPPPLRGTIAWGETLLAVSSMGDTFRFQLVFDYGTDEEREEGELADVLSDEVVADYAADLERWCRRVHERYPLAFVVSTISTDERSDRGEEGHQLGGAVMVPFLEGYAAAHADEVETEDDNPDPEGGRFDLRCMSVLVAHIPESPSPDLAARAEVLRHRFAWPHMRHARPSR